MKVVEPSNFFRRLGGRNIEIDHNWFLPATNEYTLERFINAGIYLLVRNKRRDIDEVARSCFSREFKFVSPSHSRPSLHHVDNAFELPVMMRTRFCVWVNADRSCPQFRRPGSRVSDGGSSVHAGRLRSVCVELVRVNNSNSVMFPITHPWSTSTLALVKASLTSSGEVPARVPLLASDDSSIIAS